MLNENNIKNNTNQCTGSYAAEEGEQLGVRRQRYNKPSSESKKSKKKHVPKETFRIEPLCWELNQELFTG